MHEELVEFTKTLICSLCKEPQLVSVQEFLGDEGVIQLEVIVKDSDMGSVIGHKGKTITSVRILISAAAYNMGIKKVHVNVDSF